MNNTHRVRDELRWIFAFVSLIWCVFFLDQFLPLETLGLVPRRVSGLAGIATMTFLHTDLSHLLGNTLPLITLLLLLAGSRANSIAIVCVIALGGGLLLWAFGRPGTIHIGASLLIFGLVAYLIVSGLIERRLLALLMSVFVAALYGGTLLSGILPWQTGVSWDGHLFGTVAGVISAFLFSRRRRRNDENA